jgi:predicted transcriptional regulator
MGQAARTDSPGRSRCTIPFSSAPARRAVVVAEVVDRDLGRGLRDLLGQATNMSARVPRESARCRPRCGLSRGRSSGRRARDRTIVRQSVSIPSSVARRVQALAKRRRTSASRVIVELIRDRKITVEDLYQLKLGDELDDEIHAGRTVTRSGSAVRRAVAGGLPPELVADDREEPIARRRRLSRRILHTTFVDTPGGRP